VGTIEAGKRADLILVDGDPLADITAIRRVVTVVAAGDAYDPAKLWSSVGFQTMIVTGPLDRCRCRAPQE
jgi:hypothetical protein